MTNDDDFDHASWKQEGKNNLKDLLEDTLNDEFILPLLPGDLIISHAKSIMDHVYNRNNTLFPSHRRQWLTVDENGKIGIIVSSIPSKEINNARLMYVVYHDTCGWVHI